MFEKKMSRRNFLCMSAAATSGVLLASCGGGWFSAGKNQGKPEDYYVNNRLSILKKIDGTLEYLQKTCEEKFGIDVAKTMIADTRNKFDAILPDLPYIGGDKNGLTSNLYQAALTLAFYRVMQNSHQTVEETGEVLYRSIDRMVRADPLAGMDGRLSSSDTAKGKFGEAARLSQKREYPEDWVFEFIEGDGQEFDYGVDYFECGIQKYFHNQGADELTPYLCLLDFPISGSMNTGLVRTSTLAHGATRCDFRYKNGRPCRMEWTPDFLKK